MSGQILFLDLATVTGWCDGAIGSRPVSGSMRLVGTTGGSARAFLTLEAWLEARLASGLIGRVVFEAPVGPGMAGRTNYATMYRLTNLCGITEKSCLKFGVPVASASAVSIRKAVLGHGRPASPKEAVIAEARRRGFDPADDNEADAICGWLYSCDLIANPEKATARPRPRRR